MMGAEHVTSSKAMFLRAAAFSSELKLCLQRWSMTLKFSNHTYSCYEMILIHVSYRRYHSVC